MPMFTAGPDLATLPEVRGYVLDVAESTGKADTVIPRLDLVLEEIFVNVAHHAYGGSSGNLEVICGEKDGSLTCLFRDWGVQFNPLDSEPPDTSGDIQNREVGGLGVFFVTTMTDHCSYARENDANELSISFNL